MALLIGKAAQGTLQSLLRSNAFTSVVGLSPIAINATQGQPCGVRNFNNFRSRWRPNTPAAGGFQRNWQTALLDVEVPMPFVRTGGIVGYDVLFFNGPF